MSVRISFCQLIIQACEHVSQIGVDGQDRSGALQVGSHHLDISDRPEHGAHPLQLITQTLCL